MNDSRRIQKEKLEEFFSPAKLDKLPNPYQVFSSVVEYYTGLGIEDRVALEDAVMEWLDVKNLELPNAERLRLANAIRICGYLKLNRAVEKILVIASRYVPLRDTASINRNDTPNVIVSHCIGMLGEIGDRRALDFLKSEASRCGDENPNRASLLAIDALSRIDVDVALIFLPVEIAGDFQFRERRARQNLKPFALIQETFLRLLDTHGRNIVPKIASRLRTLDAAQKQFALETFKGIMQRLVIPAMDGQILEEEEKKALVQEFIEGLGDMLIVDGATDS